MNKINFFRGCFVLLILCGTTTQATNKARNKTASNASKEFANADQRCKGAEPLKLEDMKSAEDIFSYLQNNKKIQTVDDLICCLPETYRSNYIVGMLSVAGQNGTPDSPRVIMFDPTIKPGPGKQGEPPQPPPRFMMSFNGGKQNNTQTHSLEIAQFNDKTQELEFLDLKMDSKGHHLSEKNPSLCMNCHGIVGKDSQGQMKAISPFGGPKYIFDAFGHWPRFVGGLGGVCKNEEADLLKKFEDKAIEVVKSEPRYRCLDKSKLTGPSQFGMLADFENSNLPQEQRRQSHWLQGLPEFKNYKYFLIGTKVCELSSLEDWFPPKLAQKLFDKLKIDPRLKEPGDLRLIFSKAQSEEWAKNLDARAWAVAASQHPRYHGTYTPNSSSMACDKEMPTISFNEFKPEDFSNRKLSLLSKMDTALHKGPSSTGTDIGVRIFLNGEGYDIGMASTVMTAFETKLMRGTIFDAQEFLENEPPQSKLRTLFKGLRPFLDPKNPQTICSELQRLSKEQFAETAQGSSKEPPVNQGAVH